MSGSSSTRTDSYSMNVLGDSTSVPELRVDVTGSSCIWTLKEKISRS